MEGGANWEPIKRPFQGSKQELITALFFEQERGASEAIPEGDSAVSAVHTRWMGVAKKFVLKLSAQMVIRIFGLLSQVMPVLKEWRSFNESAGPARGGA